MARRCPESGAIKPGVHLYSLDIKGLSEEVVLVVACAFPDVAYTVRAPVVSKGQVQLRFAAPREPGTEGTVVLHFFKLSGAAAAARTKLPVAVLGGLARIRLRPRDEGTVSPVINDSVRFEPQRPTWPNPVSYLLSEVAGSAELLERCAAEGIRLSWCPAAPAANHAVGTLESHASPLTEAFKEKYTSGFRRVTVPNLADTGTRGIHEHHAAVWLTADRHQSAAAWEQTLAVAALCVGLPSTAVTRESLAVALVLVPALLPFVDDVHPATGEPSECYTCCDMTGTALDGGDCEDKVGVAIRNARGLSLVSGEEESSRVARAKAIIARHFVGALSALVVVDGARGACSFHAMLALVPRALLARHLGPALIAACKTSCGYSGFDDVAFEPGDELLAVEAASLERPGVPLAVRTDRDRLLGALTVDFATRGNTDPSWSGVNFCKDCPGDQMYPAAFGFTVPELAVHCGVHRFVLTERGREPRTAGVTFEEAGTPRCEIVLGECDSLRGETLLGANKVARLLIPSAGVAETPDFAGFDFSGKECVLLFARFIDERSTAVRSIAERCGAHIEAVFRWSYFDVFVLCCR